MSSSRIEDPDISRYFIALKNKRLFIAVEIPDAARKTVYQYASRVFENCGDVRPVKEAEMHITLKFLGSISGDNIDLLSNAIAGAVSSISIFSFEVNGTIDAFPSKKKAKIIFFQVGEGVRELRLLYSSLEGGLGSAIEQSKGKVKPDDFIPHITIARMRRPSDIIYTISEAGKILPVRIECKSISLFESILDSGGTRYTKLREFSLK